MRFWGNKQRIAIQSKQTIVNCRQVWRTRKEGFAFTVKRKKMGEAIMDS